MTELGVLPEDWEVRPLFSIARIVGGGTPSTAISAYWDGNISWFTPSEINDEKKYVSTSNKKISDDGLKKSSAKLLPVGTILLTTRASIGLKSILLLPATTNQGFKNLIINDDIDNEFIYYLLTIFKKELLKQASGSTFLEISPRKLGEILLCLPKSLPEQHAIAAALSDVDALLDAQERLIAKKRNIKLAAMQQLLTGKTRLPGFQEPWIKKFFGEIFEFLPTNPYSRSQFVQRGCIRNIHYGDILTKFSFIIDISKDKLPFINKILSEKNYPQKCFLQNGDVVIANTAEDSTVGKAVEVINIDGKVLSGQHTFLCRPKIRFAKGILGYLINSEKFHGQLAAYVTGIKVSSISKTSLSGLFLEFPPSFDEQRAIAAVLSDMDAELAALEARRDKLRAVKQGMMRELLTGRTRLAGAGGQHGQ